MSYKYTEGEILKVDAKTGAVTPLTNFRAYITHEIHRLDGEHRSTFLRLIGDLRKEQLPPITIPAKEFQSMTWIAPHWGVRPVVHPSPNALPELRAAIQLHSEPTVTSVYTHTGWNGNLFLTNNAAIGPQGAIASVNTELPNELTRYSLTLGDNLLSSIKHTLALVQMGPPTITWPLLAATFRPPLGPADFAVHVAGKTGTFKSETVSIFQSFYGHQMDARKLPASWSSTANALEAIAYYAKNVLLVIDDFVPFGTSWQVRQYQSTADKIFRGQGNQQGRARLNEVSTLQQTMYPRGLILSTGEDIPQGHSIRARMFILDLSPGDIKKEALTVAQKNRKHFENCMAHYIQWLATQDSTTVLQQTVAMRDRLRDYYLEIGHARTPSMIADCLVAIQYFLDFARQQAAINKKQYEDLYGEAEQAIVTTGSKQQSFLEQSDPADAFCDALRTILAGSLAHIRTKQGNIPVAAETLGWTKSEGTDEYTTWKANGPRLGWVDWDQDEIFIDVDPNLKMIKSHANGNLTITKGTLLKRLKDSGYLARVDDNRSRNTCRVTCEGHPRNVLVMPACKILQTQEIPNG